MKFIRTKSDLKADSNTVLTMTACGALIGNMVAPGYGGAILGALFGFMVGLYARKEDEKRN